ncbi:MAG: hypothetical protein K6B67_04880 [Lachnospiraceae bacterium]|nr:hypothetical protein [Lachnospiraceae bacterium]
MWTKKKQKKPGPGDFYLNGELVSRSDYGGYNESTQDESLYDEDILTQEDADLYDEDTLTQEDVDFYIAKYGNKTCRDFSDEELASLPKKDVDYLFFAQAVKQPSKRIYMGIVCLAMLFVTIILGVITAYTTPAEEVASEYNEPMITSFAGQKIIFIDKEIVFGETTVQELLDATGCKADFDFGNYEMVYVTTPADKSSLRLDVKGPDFVDPAEDNLDKFAITGIHVDVDCGESFSIWNITPEISYDEILRLYGKPDRISDACVSWEDENGYELCLWYDETKETFERITAEQLREDEYE